ncbi:NCK-interacting protein with SH3 domain [Varanus komodoensis]|nr:NCK-interacting protein with SH3 domain [Varanus komodoensis]
MYRALYGFRSSEPSSLAFAAGETFLLLERSNQHWWLVTRAGSGETGYVPASYLQRLQTVLISINQKANSNMSKTKWQVAPDKINGQRLIKAVQKEDLVLNLEEIPISEKSGACVPKPLLGGLLLDVFNISGQAGPGFCLE